MYLLYQLLLLVFLPFYVIKLIYRGFKNKAYFERIGQRFGFGIPYRNFVWLHAVSVGEVQAAVPIIKALGIDVVVSTTTPTGAAQLKRQCPEISHFFLPYDLFITKRWVKKHQPKALILMESELWPNLVRHVPKVCLANARLSARSHDRYRKIKFAGSMLAHLSLILAQKAEAELFQSLVSCPVHTVGNSKWDKQVPQHLQELAITAKQARPTLIFASTHDGEEALLLKCLPALKAERPDLLAIVVPRHPERFGTVYNLLSESPFTLHARSKDQLPQPKTDIFLADSMGELLAWYLMSDVAVVCGSFAPKGGHDPIEALMCGCQVLMGPKDWNVGNILAVTEGHVVSTTEEKIEKDLVTAFQKDLSAASAAARDFVSKHQGAAKKQADFIKAWL